MKRTAKESSKIVAKTILGINNEFKNSPERQKLRREFKKKEKILFNQIIKSKCERNGINEKHIRKVANWK